MLFKYTYPKNYKLEELNAQLAFFLNQIFHAKANNEFHLDKYFEKDFIDILNISPNLYKCFKTFFETFKTLEVDKKKEFQNRFNKSQDIEQIFSNPQIDCFDTRTTEITKLIGNSSFKELADQLFISLKLDRWEIVKHYEEIYQALPHKICPFCGIESLHHTFREDYDHLAPKKHYPLISANPKNLAPMCHSCNSKNKGEKDTLYDKNGTRITFVYPYNQSIKVSIDISGSIIPQTDNKNEKGCWIIKFYPDNTETKNWDYVFNIKYRYIEDYLAPSYEQWLDDFIKDCINDGLDLDTENRIKKELKNSAKKFMRKWYEPPNIIRGAFFDFLHKQKNIGFYQSMIKRYNYLLDLQQKELYYS